MALTQCSECGGKVSDQAPTCPHCGYDIIQNQLSKCPECESEVSPQATTCPHCGYTVQTIPGFASMFSTSSVNPVAIEDSIKKAIELIRNQWCQSPDYRYAIMGIGGGLITAFFLQMLIFRFPFGFLLQIHLITLLCIVTCAFIAYVLYFIREEITGK